MPDAIDIDAKLRDALKARSLAKSESGAGARRTQRVAALVDSEVRRAMAYDRQGVGFDAKAELAKQRSLVDLILTHLDIDPADPWGDLKDWQWDDAMKRGDFKALQRLQGGGG